MTMFGRGGQACARVLSEELLAERKFARAVDVSAIA